MSIKAVAYFRTSSAANVGTADVEKDSENRQRQAIDGFAQRAGSTIVEEFADMAVSGVDPIEIRPGFAALLDRIEGNGVRTVIVEDASRFARDLMTQEAGLMSLINRGVKVFASNGDELTQTDDPMRTAMRQIAGVFAQLEKTRLVNKLAHARKAKRIKHGKCEGRKPVAEKYPDATRLAKRLNHHKLMEKPSLGETSRKLAVAGFISDSGKPFTHKTVKAMLASRMSR
jgi:DNA invertase Pin-like site-specific DNA recombinase